MVEGIPSCSNVYFAVFAVQDRLIVILSFVYEVIEDEEFFDLLEVPLLQHACFKDHS